MTNLQILEELPKPYKTEVLYESKKQRRSGWESRQDTDGDNVTSAIHNGSFTWHDSKRGHEYWYDIHLALSNYDFNNKTL